MDFLFLIVTLNYLTSCGAYFSSHRIHVSHKLLHSLYSLPSNSTYYERMPFFLCVFHGTKYLLMLSHAYIVLCRQ